MAARRRQVDVCIVGGGPAGMMAALLLASQDVRVLVLEQHNDFAREYRGEVLMPRFIQAAKQVNLFNFLEDYPHTKLTNSEILFGDRVLATMDFTRICPNDAPFAIWMTQPTMLAALQDRAQRYDSFEIAFGAVGKELIQEDGRVVGVRAVRDDEPIEVRAAVTVLADGRNSRLRRDAGVEMAYDLHEIDVLWFSMPRPPEYEHTVRFYLSSRNTFLVTPKHPDLVQCGLILPEGDLRDYHQRGVESLRDDLLQGPPVIQAFARDLQDFKSFFPLQGKLSLVQNWARDGLLLIGDSAHTCSPVGAIGVSVAIGTAIVAADVLTRCLRDGETTAQRLGEVQRRRVDEVRKVHSLQRRMSRMMVGHSRFRRWLTPKLFRAAGLLGLANRIPKRLVTLPAPLPIDSALRLEDVEPVAPGDRAAAGP